MIIPIYGVSAPLPSSPDREQINKIIWRTLRTILGDCQGLQFLMGSTAVFIQIYSFPPLASLPPSAAREHEQINKIIWHSLRMILWQSLHHPSVGATTVVQIGWRYNDGTVS